MRIGKKDVHVTEKPKEPEKPKAPERPVEPPKKKETERERLHRELRWLYKVRTTWSQHQWNAATKGGSIDAAMAKLGEIDGEINARRFELKVLT